MKINIASYEFRTGALSVTFDCSPEDSIRILAMLAAENAKLREVTRVVPIGPGADGFGHPAGVTAGVAVEPVPAKQPDLPGTDKEAPAPAARKPRGRPKASAPAESAPAPVPAPVEAPSAPEVVHASEVVPEESEEEQPTGEFYGENIPPEVMNATRWDTVVQYLRNQGYESLNDLEAVCISTFAREVRLLRTTDPRFVRECIEDAMRGLDGTAAPAADGDYPDAELAELATMRPLLTYLLGKGVARPDLVAECERIRARVPALKNIPDIKPRVDRMLERMDVMTPAGVAA